MPFKTNLPQTEASLFGLDLKAYPPNMPAPLVVAVLDKPQEKNARTAAALAFDFTYTHPDSGAEITVPATYLTDFASIPWFVRWLLPPFGRHAKAAVVHDWLYLLSEDDRRAFADLVFLDAMDELEVSWWRSRVMYLAVRLQGRKAYAREKDTWPGSFRDWTINEDLPADRRPERERHLPTWPAPGYRPRRDWWRRRETPPVGADLVKDALDVAPDGAGRG